MTTTSATKQYDLTQSVYYIGKIPTKYFAISPINGKQQQDKRIIIIPGNPGICDYYLTFAIKLFQATGSRWTIECIDHAGHSGLETNTYILQQQIQHKLDYITQWIPKSTNLILIGHSIGAHIAIEVMKSLPDVRVARSFLLFPTIERMAISPNGARLAPKFDSKFFRTALASFVFLTSLLPNSIRERIIRWYHYPEGL